MAEHAPTLAGHVDRHVNRLLHVAARLREHLAHLPAHELGQLGLVALEQLREAEQDRASLRSRHETPVGKRRFGGGHRAIDVICAGTWKRPERLTGGGGERLERLP